MLHDTLLVTGVILTGFAASAILSAWSDGRRPRLAAIVVMIAGGLIATAVWTWPGGFTPGDLPDAFVRVVARLL